ncbi:MAG: beta-lactamase [Ilumatobacteraceae bacterium]|nr:beta-lactamase [Ilumatobacteraceae bacterium]
MNRALDAVATWPVPHAAAAAVRFDGTVETVGDPTRRFYLASLTKLLTTWAILVAVEDGSVALATPLGQPGCTLRHLLSHAGGYPFSGDSPMSAVGQRRVYSNSGIELAAGHVAEVTGIEFATYLREAVFEPLGMPDSVLDTSPAYGVTSTVADMVAFLGELASPTLLDPSTVREATTIQFPDLAGRVPGVGVFRPCPWGLGFEIHGDKHPHWMGATNSSETFGHFGAAGTMLWVDPVARTSMVALTDRRYDEWAAEALRLWPEVSDGVVAEATGARLG